MASIDEMQLCRDALQSAIASEKTEIKHETLRIIIERCRKADSQGGVPEHLAEISCLLIGLLAGDRLNLENQMLCSTAFCVAVTASLLEDRSSQVLRRCLSASDWLEVELGGGKSLLLAVQKPETFRLCICHGLLQSRSAVVKRVRKETSPETVSNPTAHGDAIQPTLAQVMLAVVVDSCSRYSHLTQLAFRVLAAWMEKVDRVDSAKSNVYEKIFDVVFTNWDSPMNGVREQNARILGLLLDVHPKRLGTLLDDVLHRQPWTVKSKYLVLAVILPKYGVAKALSECPDLPGGLVSSLHQSYLVSAGCDAYRVCVLQLDEQEWTTHFLSPIVGILAGDGANTSAVMGNLFNYWMPATLKRFPSLAVTLSQLSSANRMAVLHLARLSPSVTASEAVSSGVRDSDETVRQLSFAVLCLSPSPDLRLAREFLEENVSVDSAPFRQAVFTSCVALVRRIQLLRDAGVKTSSLPEPPNPTDGERRDLNEADFLDWLRCFLVANLEPGTNYQRKILSLRLYRLVSDTFGVQRSIRARRALISCVLDPTEDVRETAGAILLEYFREEDSFERKRDVAVTNGFVDASNHVGNCQAEHITGGADTSPASEQAALLARGLALCASPRFYETQSGALVLKVVASHLSITSLLLSQARQQWENMRSELFAAISSGCPVHGVMTALTRVALEADGPENHIVSWEDKLAILSLAEEISEHLLGVLSSKSDGITEFAPSFAEMGVAIDSATQQESDDVYLSAAHQLLLNCVWLNLKACCQLASAIGSCHPHIDLATLGRCARLITNVLTRCRHKGAIESAGLALARLVRAASRSDNNRALPGELLGQFLDSQTGGASVTRRSAGLAILVHRIVASDAQPGKPLVAAAMNRLISIASSPVSETDAGISDLPQAQALHFLRTLVQDSSLRQYVAPFISQAAILCFENFASNVWTIRNASLQLFGAVASKLVGQKKSHDDDAVGTLEEISSHFPSLLLFLLSRLRLALRSPPLHPSLVPHLSLLSKMALNHPYLAKPDVIASLSDCLFRLLSSRVHAVRKLSAKALANFTPFPMIEPTIEGLIRILSNKTQGCELFVKPDHNSELLTEQSSIYCDDRLVSGPKPVIVSEILMSKTTEESSIGCDDRLVSGPKPVIGSEILMSKTTEQSSISCHEDLARLVSGPKPVIVSEILMSKTMEQSSISCHEDLARLVSSPKPVIVSEILMSKTTEESSISCHEDLARLVSVPKPVIVSEILMSRTTEQSSIDCDDRLVSGPKPVIVSEILMSKTTEQSSIGCDEDLARLVSGPKPVIVSEILMSKTTEQSSIDRDDRLVSGPKPVIVSEILMSKTTEQSSIYCDDRLVSGPKPVIVSEILMSKTTEESSIGCDDRLVSKPIGENQLNGLLLTLQYLADRFTKESSDMSRCVGSIANINNALAGLRELSFKSRHNLALASKVTNNAGNVYDRDYLNRVLETIADRNGNIEIGLGEWASVEIELILSQCPDEQLFECFAKVLEQPGNFSCEVLTVVKTRLLQDAFPNEIKSCVLAGSFSLLSAQKVPLKPLAFIEVMLLLSKQNHSLRLPLNVLESFYERYVSDGSYGLKCSSIGLSVVSNFLNTLVETGKSPPTEDLISFLARVAQCVDTHSCPLTSDEDQRLNAASSLAFLCPCLLETQRLKVTCPLWSGVLESVYSSCVTLLQDENCQVRREAAIFASQLLENVQTSSPRTDRGGSCKLVVLNPYRCLRCLFEPECLGSWFGRERALGHLWSRLDLSGSLEEARRRGEVASPFDHGTSNVYAERAMIVEWSTRAVRKLLETEGVGSAMMDIVRRDDSYLDQAWRSVSQMTSTNAVDPDCVYLVAKKLSSQLEVLDLLYDDFCLPAWSAQLQEFLYYYGLVL